MNKNLDMALYRSKVAWCGCVGGMLTEQPKDMILYFNRILPPEYNIETFEEQKVFICVYDKYRIHLFKKFLDDRYCFSSDHKSYRALKKTGSLEKVEEAYGGYADHIVFLFQTMFDFFYGISRIDGQRSSYLDEVSLCKYERVIKKNGKVDVKEYLSDEGIVVYEMLLACLLVLEPIGGIYSISSDYVKSRIYKTKKFNEYKLEQDI